MTQFYIGVKIIEAWKEEKDGNPGYGVKYPDGYVSWSPKEAFEKAYLPMGLDPSKVSELMVIDFIKNHEIIKLDPKTTLLKAELITGFTQYETSSCVDPKNFSEKIGEEICISRVKDSIWKFLGFVVQWGRFGLKQHE
jgi:N4 Gp49/Sf6 Gp66 family protein